MIYKASFQNRQFEYSESQRIAINVNVAMSHRDGCLRRDVVTSHVLFANMKTDITDTSNR